MTNEDFVAYLIQVLWVDYGVAFCRGEDDIFILKMLTAIEEVEKRAKGQVREAVRLQTWLN